MGNKVTIRRPKWTSEGIRAKRNQGWAQEGISKFDEYCSKVEKDRAQTERKMVDAAYMETKREETTKDEERKRKRERRQGTSMRWVGMWHM